MNNSAVRSDYDVIVLGGGAPGEHCAAALAEGGLRVALVERNLVGGESIGRAFRRAPACRGGIVMTEPIRRRPPGDS